MDGAEGADAADGVDAAHGLDGANATASSTTRTDAVSPAVDPAAQDAAAERHHRDIAAPRVLVLGGAGFIGRHVVEALLAQGARPIVASRRPRRRAARLPNAPAWREAHLERLQTPQDWQTLLEDCDLVINCVGILRQRWGETYERVHHRAPGTLAAACAARGLRLLHVSALGLEEPARSRFLTSKRAGEAAIRAAGGDWHIVRPSLLDGEGGYGAYWMRRVARWPLHPLPRGATGRIAALDVRDLGEAIARLALAAADSPACRVREHELGGVEARTLCQYLAALRAADGRAPARVWRVPDALVRIAAHVCDVLHATPFSFGHWELLQRDNLPRGDDLARLLQHPPRAVGGQNAGASATSGAGACDSVTASRADASPDTSFAPVRG